MNKHSLQTSRPWVFFAAVFFFGSLLPLSAADAPQKKWKNVAELSSVSSNGNTKTSSTAAKDTYNYNWLRSGLELIAAGMGARDSGVVTAEQYMASEKYNYDITDRNYALEKAGWNRNRFAGIDDRYDLNVGLGRHFMKGPKNKLFGEAGVGYVYEDRVGSPVNDFMAGRFYGKDTYAISATATFSQDLEYIQSMKFGDDYRFNAETALTSSMSTHLGLKLGYVWHFVNSPPVGYGKNDTITTIALVATY